MNAQQLTHCLAAAFEIFYQLALLPVLAKLTIEAVLVNGRGWTVATGGKLAHVF
jgi:hypothetical protein